MASENTVGVGHNSIAGDKLKQFVEQIENLEEQKAGIADDVKAVYAVAKGTGFETKIIRKVVKLRKQDKTAREEEESLTELYLHALGMI